MFLEDSDGPEKDLQMFYSIEGKYKGSTAAAVWYWLTTEEAETGLVPVDVLAVQRWWLEERRFVVV